MGERGANGGGAGARATKARGKAVWRPRPAGILAGVNGPEDLKAMPRERLAQLASEIRDFLVDAVSRTGGHLGPNLGVVELTIALHRVFDSPRDRILFDVGHQAYVHKILTGRQSGFSSLRQGGGLSGYPSQAESAHDVIENSHASTALSYADGLAKAYQLRGETDRAVVAVVGDGALTGGMCWEALNNIAAAKDRRVVVVVNDNGRSYSPTIGGFAEQLAALRLTRGYERTLSAVKETLGRTPLVGSPVYDALHGAKEGLKDVLAPQGLFADLGLKYVGPVDGHDEQAVEVALRRAKDFGGPVIVHCLTRKGFGYQPAETDEEDKLHGPSGAFDPATGKLSAAPVTTWTDIFGDEIVRIGSRRPDVVAITAAMLNPVGLAPFAASFPDRTFDVGIAEQHAVTSAAGLALGGMHPVVCLYATFANRALDQIMMDVALHDLPVTFVLDRAGITGPDGASHHGMWDLSILQVIPQLRIAAPRDGARVRELLNEAVADQSGPTVLRFSKGAAPADVVAIEQIGGLDVLRKPAAGCEPDVLLISVGAMARTAVEVADRLNAQGIGVTVLDPRWVSPLDPELAEVARDYSLVAVVEDNGVVGGIGDSVGRLLRENAVPTPLRSFGIPQRFLEHGKREDLLAGVGLSPQHLARAITEAVAAAAGQSATNTDSTQQRG